MSADAGHLELLAQIGRTLADERLRARLLEARTFTELRAILRTEAPGRDGGPEAGSDLFPRKGGCQGRATVRR